MFKRLREILFGVRPPKPEPVFETVSLGWVVRVHFRRKDTGYTWLKDRVFWSTLFDDREYAEQLFEQWSAKINDLVAGAAKVMVLARIPDDAEDAKYYLRLTPGDAYHGIRIDIHEVTEKREVKRDVLL